MSYKLFIVTDPTPWLDQFIETAKVMVDRCGGTSVEYTIKNMILGCQNKDGNHLMLAACEEDNPKELVSWMFSVYVHDTKEPWVEVWAFWCHPGKLQAMKSLARDVFLGWCREKGAKKILAVLTRSPRVFLKMFHETVGFKQIGIVIERRLDDATNAEMGSS